MKTTPYANSLFEQPWWLDLVAPGQWEETLVTEENTGEVLARMPYVRRGNHVVMPPLTQTLGVWLSVSARQDYGKEKQVLNQLFAAFRDMKSVDVRLHPSQRYVLPFRWMEYKIEPNFTYRLTDLSNSEQMYRQFNKTAKKNIKSAKNKVSILTECNIDVFLTLLDKTFLAQKRKNPMDKALIRKVMTFCEEHGCGKYMEARDEEGHIHSCAYFVYDAETCYYLLGASDMRYRSSGSQSLVLWEGIQFAAKHSKVFDFEGSMVEGIEQFFRQFGGECTPYYGVSRRTLRQETIQAMKPRIKRILGYKQ